MISNLANRKTKLVASYIFGPPERSVASILREPHKRMPLRREFATVIPVGLNRNWV